MARRMPGAQDAGCRDAGRNGHRLVEHLPMHLCFGKFSQCTFALGKNTRLVTTTPHFHRLIARHTNDHSAENAQQP
jgi:hypothetical protein